MWSYRWNLLHAQQCCFKLRRYMDLVVIIMFNLLLTRIQLILNRTCKMYYGIRKLIIVNHVVGSTLWRHDSVKIGLILFLDFYFFINVIQLLLVDPISCLLSKIWIFVCHTQFHVSNSSHIYSRKEKQQMMKLKVN